MNDLVTLVGGQPFTSTLAIAEGTENEHASVIKLVRTYLDDFDSFGRAGFEIAPFGTAGGMQSREVALLNEQQATLLLTYMRNSDVIRKFKRRLVHAFYELANKGKSDPMAVLADPAAMRGLLLTYTEKVIALEGKVAEQTPKAMFHDKVVAAPGALSLAEAAKVLGTGRTRLAEWLRSNHWLRRNNEPYQERIEAGLLDVKLGEWQHPERGIQRSVTALVTGKGLATLERLGVKGR